MRILGIDPGLARVGYGVIDTSGGQQRMLDCGIIRTEPGYSEGDRMVVIASDLRQLIRAWRPELAAVEKFFFYRSSTTISVVQARGVVMMTLARFKCLWWNFHRCKSSLPLLDSATPKRMKFLKR